jgi:hypothetical protein
VRRGATPVLCKTFRNFHVHEASARVAHSLPTRYGMSRVFTLKEVIRSHALAPDVHAFCAALLEQGDILFVALPTCPSACCGWSARRARHG